MAVRKARKLLTAAVGVATVSYVVGCGRTASEDERSGRQISSDTSSDDVSGASGTGVNPGPDSTNDDVTTTSVIAGNLVAPPAPPTSTPPATTVGPSTEPWTTATEDWGPTSEPWTTDVLDSSWIAGNLVAPSYPYPTEAPVTSEAPSTGPWVSNETGPVVTSEPVPSSGGTESVPPVNTDTPSDTATPPETSAPNVTGSPLPSGDLDAGAAPDASLGGGASQ